MQEKKISHIIYRYVNYSVSQSSRHHNLQQCAITAVGDVNIAVSLYSQ